MSTRARPTSTTWGFSTPRIWSRRSRAMVDEPDNLVLVYLRRLDEKFDRLAEDIGEVKIRMTTVVEKLAGISCRLDRTIGSLKRIEHRLDGIDARLGVNNTRLA